MRDGTEGLFFNPSDNPLASLLTASCYTGCSFDDEDEETDMSHYCGIDLHSNNHFVVVIDEQDKRLLERRLPNNFGEVPAETSVGEPFCRITPKP